MVVKEINVVFEFNNTNSSSADRGKSPTTNLDTQFVKNFNFQFQK